MGRLRAQLAKTVVDRDLQGHLAKAQRALEDAVDVCVRMSRHRDPKLASSVRRAKRARRKIGQALSLLDSVGYLNPVGSSDLDLTPEDDKYPGWHRPKAKE